MTHITEAFDIHWLRELVEHVDAGNVTGRVHPDLPLTIYNYTPQCAYNREWNDVTLNCRGLILDREGNIVARPFPKFFNYGEPNVTIPDKPPTYVYDKMDGSLGIAYQYDGHIAVATRGSFVSEQALWATEWLIQTYPEWTPTPDVTSLFEIIYPSNRIVVNYGDRAEMVLLAEVENRDGFDYPINRLNARWPGVIVDNLKSGPMEVLAKNVGNRPNTEGYVCVWHDRDGPSLRIKIKSDDYIAMHRIVTGLSNRIVWEHLSAGSIDQLRDSVPDELYEWFDEQVEILLTEYDKIYTIAYDELRDALRSAHSIERAKIAEYVKRASWPGLCFGLLDKKDISPMIWKMIRPVRETPVLTVQEDA